MAQVQTAYERTRKSKRGYWRRKRLLDIVLSSLALIVLSPLLLLTMLLILIDDPSASPIYVQKRCGRDGEIFSFYKFRSMIANADQMLDKLMDQNEMDGPVFKIANDPRITKVGKWIRKTSIDELPQLVNILRGDMSIVGPRPPLPRELEQYDDYARQRMSVTPGLTCFWQVSPARNTLSFNDWVDLDIKYVEERSFLLDLKLIIQTIGVVVTAQGV